VKSQWFNDGDMTAYSRWNWYELVEGSVEVKLPTIWTDEKQRWKGSERRERVEERRAEERRSRCAKR